MSDLPEIVTYLRAGRQKRSSGSVVWKASSGMTKVKPLRGGWGCVVLSPAELAAGLSKPPLVSRPSLPRKKSPPKPKPLPKPRWRELVERVRLFEVDHHPEGWPGVQMKLLSEMADELERAQTLFEREP